jgi:hypothetical protein
LSTLNTSNWPEKTLRPTRKLFLRLTSSCVNRA